MIFNKISQTREYPVFGLSYSLYYGVDSHAMIGFEEDKLKEVFGIPDNKVVALLISPGYFDNSETLYPRLKHNRLDEIVKIV